MLYLDTSVVVPLYVPEARTPAVVALTTGIEQAAISDLTVTELASAVARLARLGSIGRADVRRVVARFTADRQTGAYVCHSLTPADYQTAASWLTAGELPLRTLDALHLAVAFAHGFTLVTADRVLADAAAGVGIDTRTVA